MTQSDIPIFESIQLFNKTLRCNILSNIQCYISYMHLVINMSISIKMICCDNSDYESLSDSWGVCSNWCAVWRATKLSITVLKQDALWHIQNAAQSKGEALQLQLASYFWLQFHHILDLWLQDSFLLFDQLCFFTKPAYGCSHPDSSSFGSKGWNLFTSEMLVTTGS